MYQPAHFLEERIEVLHQLINSHPFGLLISTGEEGLVANGLPFTLASQRGKYGRLQAHMARANPQWKGLDGQSVLMVFQGPQIYVSPSLYETKRETGKVVPTWNYVMVQARGIARVHQDANWLDQQIDNLTQQHEAQRSESWKVADAPRNFIDSQLRGIIGIEIDIAQLNGKWKVSQNRPEPDRRGVAEGLEPHAPDMSALVRTYGKL